MASVVNAGAEGLAGGGNMVEMAEGVLEQATSVEEGVGGSEGNEGSEGEGQAPAEAATSLRDEPEAPAQAAVASGATRQRIWVWLARISWKRVGSKLRILVSFFQVLTPLDIVYAIAFPPVFDSMLSWLNVFQLNLIDFLPLACIFDVGYHDTLLMRTLVPMAALLVLYGVRWWASRKAAAAMSESCSGKTDRRPVLLLGLLVSLALAAELLCGAEVKCSS